MVRSWSNFWKMPAQSVLSPDGGESKEHLEESLALIEEQIDEVTTLFLYLLIQIPKPDTVLQDTLKG